MCRTFNSQLHYAFLLIKKKKKRKKSKYRNISGDCLIRGGSNSQNNCENQVSMEYK